MTGVTSGIWDRWCGRWASRLSLVFWDSDEMWGEHGSGSGEAQPSNPILQESKAPTDGNYRVRVRRQPNHRVLLPTTYLRSPPASGCGARQAADSCKGGGYYSEAAGGVGSAWDTLCSRWASWLRASHLAKSQISYPVDEAWIRFWKVSL